MAKPRDEVLSRRVIEQVVLMVGHMRGENYSHQLIDAATDRAVALLGDGRTAGTIVGWGLDHATPVTVLHQLGDAITDTIRARELKAT